MNLIHEYTHEDVDMIGCDIDMDFYHQFHDMVSHPENNGLGGAAQHTISHYVKYLRRHGERIPQAMMQLKDLSTSGEEDVTETTEETEP